MIPAWACDLVLERVLGHYRISGGVVSRQAALRASDLVLDIGGGTGGVSARIADAVRAVVVLEPNASLVRRGHGRFPRLRFVRGDGTRLPIRDGSVDVVLLVEVLHHVADADAVLRECARVLRPGGRILIEEVEFIGVGGRIARWLEERVFRGVWPRDRAGLCAGLVRLGMRPTVLEHEGFVIFARPSVGQSPPSGPGARPRPFGIRLSASGSAPGGRLDSLHTMAKDERVERLRTIPLFSACSEKQLQFIATRVEDIDLPAGKILTEQGKSGGEFFIVLSGDAEVRQDGKVVNTMKAGDHFGEIALLDNGPRTATVVATTPMRVLLLSPRQFQDVLHQDAEIAVTLLHTVTRRLRSAAHLPAD